MTDNLDKFPVSQVKRTCPATVSTWHIKERALVTWSTERNPTSVFMLITQLEKR